MEVAIAFCGNEIRGGDRPLSEKAIAVIRQLAKKKVIISLEDRRSH